MANVMWWLIGFRAVLVTVFVILSARLVVIAYKDRVYNRLNRLNGMCELITTGQIRTGLALTAILTVSALGSFASWLAWDSSHDYRMTHLVASLCYLTVTFGLGYIVVRDSMDHQTLVPMARDAMEQKHERKTAHGPS